MKHVIVGAGGIGGLVGAALAHSGEEVTMVVRRGKAGAYPSRLRVESAFATFDENVVWAEQVPSADVVWVTVKALQLEDAIHLIEEGAAPKTIVPLLNGVDHIAVLRFRFGHDTVVPGTIAVESEKISPGHIVHRSPFAKLNLSARGRDRLANTLGQFHRLGFTGEFIENEATLMWGKLVFLAPMALSTTASDKSVSDVVSDPVLWPDLQSCVREACTVGTAEGARLNPDVVIKTIQSLPPGMRSSMQKDVEQGRTPEVDAIGGAIVRAATRHGIAVPVTERLIASVEARANTS